MDIIEQRRNELEEVLNPSKPGLLGLKPIKEDLLKYLQHHPNKRLRKKLMKNPDRYKRFVQPRAWKEWQDKRVWRSLGETVGNYMRSILE